MALAQNLLDFTPGYSFCDINRVFAYQNRVESRPKGRILTRKGGGGRKSDNGIFCGPTDGTAFPFLKKRRHVQSHDADQTARIIRSTVIVEASIGRLIPEMNFLCRLIHITNKVEQITVWLLNILVSD